MNKLLQSIQSTLSKPEVKINAIKVGGAVGTLVLCGIANHAISEGVDKLVRKAVEAIEKAVEEVTPAE